ncbi:MAG: hypothetical protein ACR2QF_04805 [Geminicoccaceae bacterium]
MGASLSASVAIGIKLSRDDIWPVITVPACEHAPSDQDKFCSVCGASTEGKKIRSNPYNIEPYEDNDRFTVTTSQLDSEETFGRDDIPLLDGEKVDCFHVVISVRHASTPYEEAWAKIEVDGSKRIADLEDELRQVIDSELVDKGEFGIWGICTGG